ncbi:MAG: hypothetical protein ACI38Y_01240 [Candidatus Methanomethylophilaceae archaeon]
MFFRKRDEVIHQCSICGSPNGGFHATDGWICPMCMPLDRTLDRPCVEDIRSMQIKDPELMARIESFTDSEVLADLHFDDDHRLFFKGPYPNRCIPVLSYSEISGYRIIVDGRSIAFNSVGGERSVMRIRTDEFIAKASKDITDIILEIDSSRSNVKVRPYVIRSMKIRVCDSKQDCLRFAMKVSDRFDSIIENNILDNNKSN